MSISRSTWFVLAAMLVGFAVACSSPTAPLIAKEVPGPLAVTPERAIAFRDNSIGYPVPTFYNNVTTDVYPGGIVTAKITLRQMTTIYASAWSLELDKLADHSTPGVSPVCVDNASGELVRCAARIE